MSISKMYCPRCKDFTYRTWTKNPSCDRCRGKGTRWRVWLVILAPISLFIWAVYRAWKGDRW